MGKRALESQVTELEMRLAEANEVATKGGRAAMAKLENRIRELEIELGSVQSKTSDTYKMKTTRIKIACLIWLASCKLRSRLTRGKLKKLRRLLLSTWPSSARPNKTLRKLRREPRWLVPPLQFCKSTLPQSISHEELQLGDWDI